MTAKLVRILGVALFVAFALAPLVWCAYASLFGIPGESAPHLSLDAYREILGERHFARALARSFIVATTTTLIALLVAAPCAYALARLRMRGRPFILGAVLAVSMFPQVSIVGPLFLLLRALHLVDTTPGLVLPYVTFATPLAVWLLVAFFKQLPKDLEEQALVDGASRLRILVQVIAPLALPGLATAAILTFVYCWNELLFALSFTVSPDMRTAPVAITLLRGRHEVPWPQILAASVMATLPVAALVVVFQRWIVRGLVAGAVKG